MTAVAHLMVAELDRHRYSDDEAHLWLLEQGDGSCNRTFHTTARRLMKEWCWSAWAVMKLLTRLEKSGAIRRQILPDNGGTLITVLHNSVASKQRTIAMARFVKNLPYVLSARQLAHLSQTYEAIIYGQSGYEWATIEHLEIIEQALLPSQMLQAA